MAKIQKILLCSLFFILLIFAGVNISLADEKSADFNNGIVVVDNGLEYEIKKQGNTIGEILEKAGIEINEKDIIFPSKETVYQPGTKIIIERATPVILNLYGKRSQVFSQKETVFEVLIENKIEFKKDDLINVDFYAETFPGIEIKIWKRPEPKPQIIKTGEIQTGIASWYSFVPGNFCASTNFRKGTKLLVTNLESGKSIIVTVNDYGPFSSKIIDLEKTAFSKLAPLSKGIIKVKVEKIYLKY